jgi:release factor glutamine methyltransferase
MTVADALREATARLREAGVDSPDHDAEVLLRHVLGWDRTRLLVEWATPLPPGAEPSFLAKVAERAGRRPLQHLTGEQWFWRHAFRVTPDVLVPRPETERIVEEALRLLGGQARPLVVDVGTGSGCIALSIAAERPDALVVAIDLSAAALVVARENASRLGLTSRVRFLAGDLLEPIRDLARRVDLVVSNPPYVDPRAAPGLAPEVRLFEPALALFPPGEPYHVYRRLAPQAAAALCPGGALVLEIGQGMADEVARIVEGAGFRIDRVIPDLQGIPRTVVAHTPGITTPPSPAVD